MAREEQEEVIERGSGNVFADLGFEDAEELLAKAKLVHAISKAMEAKSVDQKELAALSGADETQISKLLRGITDGFSSDLLLRILNRLDQDVDIIIRPRPQSEHRAAHVSISLGQGL